MGKRGPKSNDELREALFGDANRFLEANPHYYKRASDLAGEVQIEWRKQAAHRLCEEIIDLETRRRAK